jgi:hypothetical protein
MWQMVYRVASASQVVGQESVVQLQWASLLNEQLNRLDSASVQHFPYQSHQAKYNNIISANLSCIVYHAKYTH